MKYDELIAKLRKYAERLEDWEREWGIQNKSGPMIVEAADAIEELQCTLKTLYVGLEGHSDPCGEPGEPWAPLSIDGYIQRWWGEKNE